MTTAMPVAGPRFGWHSENRLVVMHYSNLLGLCKTTMPSATVAWLSIQAFSVQNQNSAKKSIDQQLSPINSINPDSSFTGLKNRQISPLNIILLAANTKFDMRNVKRNRQFLCSRLYVFVLQLKLIKQSRNEFSVFWAGFQLLPFSQKKLMKID